MKFWYDFHIHTCLSPCASDEMTPNNIVNMACLKGLDAICVLDHNNYINSLSAKKVAKDKDIIVLLGIEVETREEVHVVIMFDNNDVFSEFGEIILDKLIKIDNKSKLFGNQIIMDNKDLKVEDYTNLLLSPVDLSYKQVYDLSEEYGGVFYPAHIDRKSNSVISNLGMIPIELDNKYIEISNKTRLDDFKNNNKHVKIDKYQIFKSSDSHYLKDINEKINYIETYSNRQNFFRDIKNGNIEIINDDLGTY